MQPTDDGQTAGLIPLIDPRTGRERATSPDSGPDAVAAAVRRARDARSSWAGATGADRSGRLLRLAARLDDRLDDYVRAEVAGTGKPTAEASAEIRQSADVLRFYAGAALAATAPAGGQHIAGRESWVRWEPLGTVAAIVPWNYPLLMAMWRAAPALAAGNTVVLKPAQTTPDSALLLARDADEILGESVLTVLTGGRETGRLLVESPVDAVAFTGSYAGGRDVAARAGTRRVSLELGGNAPAIVLPDAPDYTFDSLVRACVYNAGQSCAAPARVITLAENHDRTVEELARSMRSFRAGADFGPLNNAEQAARYDRIIGASAARDQRVAPLSVAADEAGGHWRPGLVLADLPPDDPAVTEEVFGPVLTVQAARDVSHAIELANSVDQALAGSVWGSDASLLLSTAAAMDCGEVWINCHLEQTPQLPHGGRGSSGHGTDLSTLALAEYQRPKCVTVRVDTQLGGARG
ncbi:aldehyde dehydrogenase family protein [Kitasatospora viridis]|uniref:Acyl-CoA reductase-like NAD-dependent aldehyde dehydrogenase n=1 Tax=Kitasatospora viridis TaxID=281105 RepID=A0A561UAB1_9ACTN|nr:aldehyde dehydrogenase family protein [Kitasatospora viridis]TWF96310.1 acyl-CoA reductase-like NAD-dependent aldehyde dehydrogenase [Kitasatospora viridis]